MNLLRRISVFTTMLIVLTVASSFSLTNGNVSTKFRSANLDVSISGTSSLHDWEMKSKQGKCEVVFDLGENDKITGVSGLNFTLDATTIKSEYTMMDNNTYKALKTKTNKNISFVLSSGAVTQSDPSSYLVKVIGNLTIAGKTQKIDLAATAKYNGADKSFTINGSKKLKMTDYGVDPPTAMFGTIKTGNDITISFSSKIIK
jgi:polyisoprenoid-binding protein YceI